MEIIDLLGYAAGILVVISLLHRPVALMNAVGFLIACSILILKIKYK